MPNLHYLSALRGPVRRGNAIHGQGRCSGSLSAAPAVASGEHGPSLPRLATMFQAVVVQPPQSAGLKIFTRFAWEPQTMLRLGKAASGGQVPGSIRCQKIQGNAPPVGCHHQDTGVECTLTGGRKQEVEMAGTGKCASVMLNGRRSKKLDAVMCSAYRRLTSRIWNGRLNLDSLSFAAADSSHCMRNRLSFCSSSILPLRPRDKEDMKYFLQRLRSADVETIQVGRTTCRKAVVNEAVTATKSSEILKEGALLEFDKEHGRTMLAVVQKRDGKKNWIVEDQFGNTSVVRPQQITFIVPGVENFQPSRICSFVDQVEGLEDHSLLEVAWEEILALQTTISARDLAQILYVGANPAECYAAHRILSSSQVFFRCKQKGFLSLYEPRSSSEVSQLLEQKLAEEAQHRQFMEHITSIKAVLEQPLDCKMVPAKWSSNQGCQTYNEALKLFALQSSMLSGAQKKIAEEVLGALGLSRTPASAVELLVGMGIFPVHVNLELLKGPTRVKFSDQLVAAADLITQEDCPDQDVAKRVDLRHLKIYTIDSEDTVEIDDGLSATRLPDGRLQVWVHVADPTRWLPHDHPLTREARCRSTSIYLPTETIPMFPMNLAAGCMSLVQGRECPALTFRIILREDGSVADYDVVNSVVCPTYKMSYESVTELLSLSVDEEQELYLLAEAAVMRSKWRKNSGSVDVDLPETNVKVMDAHKPEPVIHLTVVDHSLPAHQLVSEMMILCGEVAASFGEKFGLPLPYRGQAAREIPKGEIESLPEGPCRAMALLRFIGRAEVNYNKPLPHASLGLPGYVQVTSPIRRYGDLIAHYQIKAVLRGEAPLLKGAEVEASVAMSTAASREAKRLQGSAKRYWILEFLRRLPRHTRHEALVLRIGKDQDLVVLLTEIGIQCHMEASSAAVGERLFVLINRVDPRKDILDAIRAPS